MSLADMDPGVQAPGEGGRLAGADFEAVLGPRRALAQMLAERLAAHPDGTLTEIGRSGARSVTPYAGLQAEARRILAALRQLPGIAGRDVIACFETARGFVPAAWAAIEGGLSCLPLQHRQTGSDSGQLGPQLAELCPLLEAPILVTTRALAGAIGDAGALGVANVLFTDDLPEVAPDWAGPPVGPGRVLIRTSGTTDRAKVAIFPHDALAGRFALHALSHENLAAVLYAPFDSVAGLSVVLPPNGRALYLHHDRFRTHPEEFLALIEEFRLQTFSLSSSTSARLTEALAKPGRVHDLSSLSHLRFGAEVIVPATVAELVAALRAAGAGALDISFGFSMTEASFVTSTGRADPDALTAEPGAAVSLGPCNPGWELRITDPAGQPCPDGVAGQMEVRSTHALFAGYLGMSRAQSGIDDAGWFATGDLGMIEDGALRITGRKKATIIVNGRNVSLDDIERPLRGLKGVHETNLAAVPVRFEASTTDELALFFVADAEDPEALDALCRQMVRITAKGTGLRVAHLVPVPAAEMPLTETGKIRRGDLAQGFLTGRWPAYRLIQTQPPEAAGGAALAARLAGLWQELLDLPAPPGAEENFFDLGADSLASAQLMSAVEEEFGAVFPLATFFDEPTIAHLARALEGKTGPRTPQSPAPMGGKELLRRIGAFTGSWAGARRFPESLVVGANVEGRRAPLFWVFQSEAEFRRLAGALGPDQPVYGMRSAVEILHTNELFPDGIEAICNRYLWEILALRPTGPFLLGGNCQAGLFAVRMAQKLELVGRLPERLMLLEWTYALGRYGGATSLIYGAASHTARMYRDPDSARWNADFPDREIRPIPPGHGRFFGEDTIGHLAGEIARVRPPLPRRGWFRRS
ncbi:AMP-binding protein [Pseudoroseicyclus sp. CXY001]|uniref:AMP-binding protein n=1 Tax=Pseudoroseicyclus sp. CXY001 TaxID=3242492 RepID=UPI0035716A4B